MNMECFSTYLDLKFPPTMFNSIHFVLLLLNFLSILFSVMLLCFVNFISGFTSA